MSPTLPTDLSLQVPANLPASHVPSTRPSILNRWLRFNLVGLLGAAVQLGSLSLLNRLLPHRYLLTSAVALELTLLHNVTWHLRYTWRDRSASDASNTSSPFNHGRSVLRTVTRFHLANGGVSLIGNLALMRLLVHTVHLPVVAANALAILLCSLLNYTLGNCWVFTAAQSTETCSDE